jgi:kinesin family protein 2/24
MQDAKSKGVNGRQNLDKRTARLRYGSAFQADIACFREINSHLNNGSNHIDKVGNEIQDRNLNGICVFVRKRPLFDYEFDRGDYDVVSIDNTTHSDFDECIVHNCHMHSDMKRMLVKLSRFPVTAAFDERCSDDTIYNHVARPLVRNAAEGGISTILMYGQTGSGKSHTISGIEERTAIDLFHILDSLTTVTIQFVELCGSKECKDLLSPSLSDVKIRDTDIGSVELSNATALDVSTPEDLADAIRLGKSRRATEATDKNGVSSRSHAVCQLQIQVSTSAVMPHHIHTSNYFR